MSKNIDGQISFLDNININNSKEEYKRIDELREQIAYHNKRYYEEDNPEITDYEYDMLNKELKKLESLHPEYVVTNSPTQKIGGRVNKIFEEVKHEVKMESLQDVFSYSEVEDFLNKHTKVYGEDLEFVIETKIDGLSVSLKYVDGILVQGATRGDGSVGEDVTQNILQILDIPIELKTKENITVRGEVYLPHKSFEEVNEKLEKLGKPILKNPRNAAAGTLRQLDQKLVKERKLSIYIFNVQKSDKVFKTHSESFEYLKSIGFKVIDEFKVCKKDKVIDAIKYIGSIRENLPYDIDGAVVKIDDLKIREDLGSTVKVPRWAVAFKYPPEQKETILKDIVFQVGRTGQVTPMAILEPITVAGSTISKTTLHNFDYIKEKDIQIGDVVVIQKAGDVIPEVVKVIKEKRKNTKVVTIPTKCPVCNEELEKDEKDVALRCTNLECPALIYRSIIHFASRDAMDIAGLGVAIIDRFLEIGLIKKITDIYKIKYEDIANLERFEKKSATNLLNSIENSKKNSLEKLLFGLGIRHIGKKAAITLANSFNDIYEISNANYDTLISLDDFGDVMVNSLIHFFSKEETKQLIQEFEELGVNLKSQKKEKTSSKLENLTFVITGSFEKYKRQDIEKMITDNMGKSSTSVSKKTSFVIAGEDAGSKLNKANELGIKVLSINEFLDMIK